MPWIYDQSNGRLYYQTPDADKPRLADVGYSGHGRGRNNPGLEQERSVGPIPRGRYDIGLPRQSEKTGPHVMDLTPNGHTAHGRTAFQIHGNNKTNNASRGCIILTRPMRERISASNDRVLIVQR